MRNLSVIFRYFLINNTSLIKLDLHITVSDLPEQEDDIFTHKKMKSATFPVTLLYHLIHKAANDKFAQKPMRSKEICGLFGSSRSAVTRILWQFVSTLCKDFFFEFYANINITPAFATDAI